MPCNRHPHQLNRSALIIIGSLSVVVVFVILVNAVRSRAHLVAHSLADMETVGHAEFPNVYVGGVREADGSMTFYVTKRDPALLATTAKADTDGIGYKIVVVPHTYAYMSNLTRDIAHQSRALIEADGIRLVNWGPDLPTNMVLVHLSKPTSTDLAKFAAAHGVPAAEMTVSSYPAEVEAFLRDRFGSGLTVQRAYVDPITPSASTTLSPVGS